MKTQLIQNRFYFSLLLLTFLINSPIAFATQISQEKNGVFFVKIQNLPVNVGDIVVAKDPTGKSKGFIRIVQVKGDRAAGRLLKGEAKAGYTLEARKASTAKTSEKRNQSSRQKPSPASRPQNGSYGFTVGYGTNSMDVKLTLPTERTVKLSGSGFSVNGLYDMHLFSLLWFRGLFGYESFNVKGEDFCGDAGNETCKASIGYLAADIWGRLMLSEGTFRPWVGGGLSLYFPATKSATAVKSISSTSVISPGLGFDYMLANGMYIPVQFEYGLFPQSADVKASQMILRVGLGFGF